MRYYFLGIAGTAMASLAALLKLKGHQVWGTDQGIYPPMSDFLRQQNIPVWEGYEEAHLEQPFDAAVIGNALSRGNVEVEAILNRKLPFTSLPELIHREFIRHHHNIVITGTHGKTTTTALMGWVLEVADYRPTCLIGGVSRNFGASIRLNEGDYFVIEGDEYDCAFFDKRPKFLHYFPDHLIINNLEFDHADIYPNLEAIQDAFRKLLRIVPGKGLVIANGDSPAVREVLEPVYSRLQRFGADPQHEWRYELLETGAAGSRFRLWHQGRLWGEFQFPFPGEFQVQNATAVAAVAHDLGISATTLARAFRTFRGVRRRMEHWGQWNGAEVFDDFAHHPTAIAVTLQAMRKRFPDRRLVALFEPRTNTTVRKVFQKDLAEALSPADVVVLTPIHRAERLPEDSRLSLTRLSEDLRAQGVVVHGLKEYREIVPTLETLLQPGDVLVLLTNGSLGGEYQPLRERVQQGL